MTDSNATELLPCPCCGSEHVETCREFWGGAAPAGSEFTDEVMCDDCGVTAPSIAAWNTRTEQAVAATLGRGECELREASWDDGSCTWGVICSACGAKFEHERGSWWGYCPNCGKAVKR